MSLWPTMPQNLRGEKRPDRCFYWRWPVDGQSWFMWAAQNYGSDWIVWRVGPLNYRVQVAKPGQNGGYVWHRKDRSADD